MSCDNCEWGGLCHPSQCSFGIYSKDDEYTQGIVGICSCGATFFDAEEMTHHATHQPHNWVCVPDYAIKGEVGQWISKSTGVKRKSSRTGSSSTTNSSNRGTRRRSSR